MLKSVLLDNIRVEKNPAHYAGRRLVRSPKHGMKIAKPRIDNGLLAAQSFTTTLITLHGAPAYQSRVELAWYYDDSFLRLGNPHVPGSKEGREAAYAVCAARRVTGFDGALICMPPGWYVRRGIVLNDTIDICYAVLEGNLHRGSISGRSVIDLVSRPSWSPLDDSSPEICRIADELAYESALHAYRTSLDNLDSAE